MSWSIWGVGTPSAVKKYVEAHTASFSIPEETAAYEAAKEAIKTNLGIYDPDKVVRVSASGHAYQSTSYTKAGGSLDIKIEDLGTLLE
jgi:hypothetical protein